MLASVHLRLPDGRIELLFPGDILGRTGTAALRFDDPHVSEAHAMVALRGAELVLLALRRRLYVNGNGADTVVLFPGLKVRLSPAVELEVVTVALPHAVLGLEGDGVPTQALPGTCSLVQAPHLRLVAGVSPQAVATFWTAGEGWRARIGEEAPFDLAAGQALTVAGRELRAVAVPLAAAGQEHTRADPYAGPLRIIAWFDTVHIHRGDAPPTVVTGLAARLLSELVAAGAPVPWHDVAGALWPGADRDLLRRRWDVQLVRLRDRLREAGLRPDLLRPAGTGLIELVLHQGDVVEDRS